MVIPTGFPRRPSTACTAPSGDEALIDDPTVAVESLSRSITNDQGQTTRSSSIAAWRALTMSSQRRTSSRETGANYLETDTFYDDLGRTLATVDPAGQMSYTVYDGLAARTDQWSGTVPLGGSYADNQSIVNTFGTWLQSNSDVVYGDSGVNLYKLSHSGYDTDGNLTESDAYFDPKGSSGPRTTYYQFDWGDRQTGTLGPDGVATISTLDNLDEATQTQTYANATYSSGAIGTSAGNLRARKPRAITTARAGSSSSARGCTRLPRTPRPHPARSATTSLPTRGTTPAATSPPRTRRRADRKIGLRRDRRAGRNLHLRGRLARLELRRGDRCQQRRHRRPADADLVRRRRPRNRHGRVPAAAG